MEHFGPFYVRLLAHFWPKGICFELDPWLDFVLLLPATDLSAVSAAGTVVDHLKKLEHVRKA